MRAAVPKQVASGVYQLGLGGVNVFFVEDDDGGLWLIDAGIESGAERIGGGLRALGRAPQSSASSSRTCMATMSGGWPRSRRTPAPRSGCRPRMLRLCARVCAAGR